MVGSVNTFEESPAATTSIDSFGAVFAAFGFGSQDETLVLFGAAEVVVVSQPAVAVQPLVSCRSFLRTL